MAHLSGLRRILLGLAWLALWPAHWVGMAHAASPVAVLTILDGDARLIEGARCLAAAEGLKLSEQTLLETGPKTRLLRVEWPDGPHSGWAGCTTASTRTVAVTGLCQPMHTRSLGEGCKCIKDDLQISG